MREIPGEEENNFPHPEEWRSGDAPMTTKQRDYLASLAMQLGVIFDEDLTKAQAACAIDHFKSKLKKRWCKAKSEPMTERQKCYLQFMCERNGGFLCPPGPKCRLHRR
jgi:hypothetical protein